MSEESSFFSIELSEGGMRVLDVKTGYPVLLNTPTYSYTYRTDDIKEGVRSGETSPYDSREGLFTVRGRQGKKILLHDSAGTELSVEQKEGVLRLDLSTEREDFSELGLNLPINFMGKFNGGGHDNQYLLNSPYISSDNAVKFCYLSNQNGRNLVVLFLSEADGWRVEYSRFSFGHYFERLKCLSNFDRAYGTESNRKSLSLALFISESVEKAIERISEILQVPMLFYKQSYTLDGRGELIAYGDCDKVEMTVEGKSRTLFPKGNRVAFEGARYKTEFVPYRKGVRGGNCSVYGFVDLFGLWKKANEVVGSYEGEFIPDDNACEGQCWVESLLRYRLRFGGEGYSKRIKEHFANVLMQTDEQKARAHATVLSKPLGNLPAYHIFQSTRLQEQFFAVSIFLNAYRCFGEEIYLQYCLNSLDVLLAHYQTADGRIERAGKKDYSTVTCPMISVVDVATFFRERDKARYEKYANAARRLAEYIFIRGFSFPTEGCESNLAEEEYEEGSISCSALALLYYCAKIERVDRYVRKAKEILDFHDKWVMRTPDCNVFHSTLRWWETIWEGDADGPGLCCGHGWTIWRAEADYWFYKLTGDKEYLSKSLCGFTSNFAKFNPSTGEGKSIFSMDYISGGGYSLSKEKVKYKISLGLPNDIDVRLAYYAWNRADATIFNEEIFK